MNAEHRTHPRGVELELLHLRLERHEVAGHESALVATGGRQANSVERDSEDGATWEVEVTKTDGKTVDVRLDEAYAVVVIEGDSADEGSKP